MGGLTDTNWYTVRAARRAIKCRQIKAIGYSEMYGMHHTRSLPVRIPVRSACESRLPKVLARGARGRMWLLHGCTANNAGTREAALLPPTLRCRAAPRLRCCDLHAWQQEALALGP